MDKGAIGCLVLILLIAIIGGLVMGLTTLVYWFLQALLFLANFFATYSFWFYGLGFLLLGLAVFIQQKFIRQQGKTQKLQDLSTQFTSNANQLSGNISQQWEQWED
jgi:hypothetical protein